MRLRNIPGSREAIRDSEYTLETPVENKGKWREIYGISGEIHIEIGMGKGRFIMDMAAAHPEVYYIGIEKYSSVLLRGLQKLELSPLPNITFIRMEAEEIENVFDKGEVDRIYLNFSDPWPKDRHAKRRLPSGAFLARYGKILSSNRRVEFKTDNRDLFDFALAESADEGCGFRQVLVSYDLHADQELMKDNIMTEYEEKFSGMGNPIYKLVLEKI